MKLKKYNEKRNFKSTSEPVGKVQKKTKQLRFVVQHHNARADHYDFRLEYDGVLLSWAVPKGLSNNPKIKRLAVMVEDHPVSYINFEGVIPKGNYGAGSVEIFDGGFYAPLEDFKSGLKKGHIKFVLAGEILKGAWSLIKTDEKNWIIVKSDDEFASDKKDISVTNSNPFKTCSAQLALLSNEIPKGKEWLFEIKYDGYRIIAFIENEKVKLVSRNGLDYSNKFSSVSASLEKVAKDIPMVLDGEVVCFDKNGRSDFGLLQENIKKKKGGFTYVVFDVLAYSGKDLRNEPLDVRKDYLEKILIDCPNNIAFSSYVIGKGKQSFSFAKKMNLEGIIAKKLNSKYLGKRTDDWLKIKCYKRQEFVIVGYTTTNKNKLLSAILVGYFNKEKLIFAGKVGTGFTEQKRLELNKIFKDLKKNKCPLSENINIKDNVVWLTPTLVAEVQYAELTKEKVLRQPSFVGLRQDKKSTDVVLEEIDEIWNIRNKNI